MAIPVYSPSGTPKHYTPDMVRAMAIRGDIYLDRTGRWRFAHVFGMALSVAKGRIIPGVKKFRFGAVPAKGADQGRSRPRRPLDPEQTVHNAEMAKARRKLIEDLTL